MRSEPLDRTRPDSAVVSDAGTDPAPSSADDLGGRTSLGPGIPNGARATMSMLTADEIVQHLRALADRGVRIVPREIRRASGEPLLNACMRRFGSIRAARAAAGIAFEPRGGRRAGAAPAVQKRATKPRPPASGPKRRRRTLRPIRAAMPDADELVRELRALADRGVRVVPNQIRAALGDGIIKACYAHFGSVPAARSAAGLATPARAAEPTISRDDLLTVLRAEVARRHGIPPKSDDLSPIEQRSVRAHFGGYAAALAVLGLHPRSGRWTRDSVIAALRAWVAQGKPLSSAMLNEERLDLWNAVLRHVGSFREAWALVGDAVADSKPPAVPASAPPRAGRAPKTTSATVADQAIAAARALEDRVRALAVAIAQAAIARALAEVEQDVRARLAAVTWTPT